MHLLPTAASRRHVHHAAPEQKTGAYECAVTACSTPRSPRIAPIIYLQVLSLCEFNLAAEQDAPRRSERDAECRNVQKGGARAEAQD
jgi:hypothetical protein